MSTKFSSREDEMLINLVKQYPGLYNCKLKSYKDIIVKTNMKTIAEELGKKENDCKTRWKNIRDYYKRKRRNEALKEMSIGSHRMDSDFFQKYKHLSFLESTAVVERETVCSVDEFTQEAEDHENVFKAKDNVETTLADNSNASTESSIETPKGMKRNSDDSKEEDRKVRKTRQPNEKTLIQEFHKSRLERTSLIKELLQNSEPQQDPAITMFFQSIAATVSKFTPQLQAKAKVQIMNIVAQLELQNNCPQNLHHSITNFSTSTDQPFTTAQLNSVFSRPSSSADSYNINSPVYPDISNSYSRPPSNTSVNSEPQFSDNDNFIL